MENGWIGLWKYNKSTGYWELCRTCLEENAQQWLAVWQRDEPDETFKLSKKKPKLPKSRFE